MARVLIPHFTGTIMSIDQSKANTVTELFELVPDWLKGAVGSAAIISTIGVIFRKAISDLLANALQHKFAKKIEELKSELRGREDELVRISEFLTKSHFERNSPLIERRLDSAEAALRSLHSFAPLSMCARMLQSIKLEEVAKNESDANLQSFFQTLDRSIKIDDALQRIKDEATAEYKLYLSEDALKYMEAYTGIVVHAAIFIKAGALGQTSLLNEGNLRSKVEKILPNTKETFDEFGESYAYFWTDHFFDQAFKALRSMTTGSEQASSDLATVTSVTLSSRLAQFDVSKQLDALPERFKKSEMNQSASAGAGAGAPSAPLSN